MINSVQGRTISTIARMSLLFGISKTDWTHSSSLPDSENPRDRTAEHMENRNKWARKNQDRERAAKATQLAGLTSAHNPPIAEAGSEVQPRYRLEATQGALSRGVAGATGGSFRDPSGRKPANTKQRRIGREKLREQLPLRDPSWC